MSDIKFQRINELGYFVIDKDGRPWSFLGGQMSVLSFGEVGRSAEVTVQGYMPLCLEIVNMIHGNHIAVTHVLEGRLDEYKEEQLAYLFRHCHEISRLRYIGSVQFDGTLVTMKAVFIAHLEVIE